MKPAIDSSDAGVRKFGIVLAAFFALLSGAALWKGHAPVVKGALAAFFLLGTAFPPILRPVQKAWMTFAFAMGKVMTLVILTVFYVLFLTPLSLVARAFGVDFLRPKRASADTYWLPGALTQDDKARYAQQF